MSAPLRLSSSDSRTDADNLGRSTTLLESESYGLAKAMTQQSLVKHFLTEGDRMIVGRVSPLKDQGGYAVATNYGSFTPRQILMCACARLLSISSSTNRFARR